MIITRKPISAVTKEMIALPPAQCSLPIVLLLVVILLLQYTATAYAVADQEKKQVYIVYMGEREHSDVELLTQSHHEMLNSVLGSKEAALDSIIYSYRHGFSGFAAKMTESEAQYIAELAGVVEVFPNRLYKMHTTRSWDFLGLSANSKTNLLHDANQGDGVVIGVIDSGVWPEAKSFSDEGLELGPIPSKWKGICQSGAKFKARKYCNKKLIGARYFVDGLNAANGKPINMTEFDEYFSPRDAYGHGSHCASTAAGSFVRNVSVNGLGQGTIRGGAPKARLAVYKVVWGGKGSSADILKAFDEAIHDGVDVLSVSLGLDVPIYTEVDKRDLIHYGSFHAAARGITVVCAAGNSGPMYQTVDNVAPWVISVAATTVDRSFPTPIMLGNNQNFEGVSQYYGKDTGFVKLGYRDREDAEGASYCETIKGNETWVVGKVVLCFTLTGTERDILQAAAHVVNAGGLGLIATKKTYNGASAYNYALPIVLVTFDVGTQILNYIRSTKDPKVRLKPTRTYVGKDVSTYIASFSSRGPNSLSPSVLKPDIAAPGVDILAAYTVDKGHPNGYSFSTGTSMATPHIAGIAALLKSLHPNWSPAAISSALVTTAWTTDPNSGEPIFAQGEIPKIADPFDYGGGLVNPNAARNPGLIYDLKTQDYINYLCAMKYTEKSVGQMTGQAKPCQNSGNSSVLDLNLPSITVPNLKESVTITRTVTNVGHLNSKYEAVIVPPLGTTVKVSPNYLEFSPEVKKISFKVTIKTLHKITTEYYFGSLTWTDKVHQVRIPLSVRTEFPKVYG